MASKDHQRHSWLKSTIKAGDVKQKMEEAFKRHAILDAKDMEANVDSPPSLSKDMSIRGGHDDSPARAAWAAPGVANVENRLSVQ